MKKNLSLFLIFILYSTNVCSQSKKEIKRWDEAIEALEQTKFIISFKEDKQQIEDAVDKFIRDKRIGAIKVENNDYDLIKDHYQETAGRFNKILEIFKDDFTNPYVLHDITNKPDYYTDTYQAGTKEAYSYYSNYCKIEIDKYYDNGAIAGITEVLTIIALIKEVVNFVETRHKRLKNLSGEYIERHFISDLRFRDWVYFEK